MKKILLGTALSVTAAAGASAQGIETLAAALAAAPSSMSVGGVGLSFGTTVRTDRLVIDRSGAWNGAVSDSQARADLDLRSAHLFATAHFATGSTVTFSYGQLVGMTGRNYGFNGQPSTQIFDGEGHILGLAIGAHLGGGFAIDAGIQGFDLRGTRYEHPRGNHIECPNVSFDFCQFTHVFVTGDVILSYTGDLGRNAFYSVGGGARFLNGYAQVENWSTNGDDDTENVAPLDLVEPVVTASIGYTLGAYALTASAMLVGERLSYGLGLEMTTGARDPGPVAMGRFAVGAFVEQNRFSAERQVAYTAAALAGSGAAGYISTDITSAGVSVSYSTATTDLVVAFGTVTAGEGVLQGGQGGEGGRSNAFALSEVSGEHLRIAAHTDLVALAGATIRGDVELDYMDLHFARIVQTSTGGGERSWDDALVQTLTAAVGASYHREFAPGVTGYAGLDYMVSASRQILRRLPDRGANSNYNSGFEDSYRLRVGGSYAMGAMTATVEVSGNHDAGASVAIGGAWSF